MTSKWDELKIGGSDNTLIYLGLGAAVIAVVAVFIVRAFKKKKQSAYMD